LALHPSPDQKQNKNSTAEREIERGLKLMMMAWLFFFFFFFLLFVCESYERIGQIRRRETGKIGREKRVGLYHIPFDNELELS
jgi:hypothetical protein